MKVLFSNPPWHGTNGNGYFSGVRAGSRWPFTMQEPSLPLDPNRIGYSPYPVFLASAASYAKKHTNAEVHFRDSIALREGYVEFFNYIYENTFDFIVIESASSSWDHDSADIIPYIHFIMPECKIIVTGPIVASRGEEILAKHPVHAACKGEYEKGVVRVINGESGLIDFDLLTVEEMNAAPFPWLDDLHWNRYWDANPKGQIWPHLQFWSSRSCVFRCVFCSFPANMTNNDPTGEGKREIRNYNADWMEAFLRDATTRFPFKCLYDDSDIFNASNKHVLEMCRVYKKIGLPWHAMTRIDTSSDEVWGAMRDAGCVGIKCGFESGSQRVVDQIVHKQLDLDAALSQVLKLKRMGFTVHGTFTVGLPGETPAERQQTMDYIKSLYRMGMDTHQLSGTATIDGTPLDTLLQVGSLKKYPGAKVDETFKDRKDGNQKMAEMCR